MNSKLIVSALLSLIAVEVSQLEPPVSAQTVNKIPSASLAEENKPSANYMNSTDENHAIGNDIQLKKNQAGNNELSWTASETMHSESFLIQRSSNGKQFKTIGRRGAKEKTYSYSFIDMGYKKDAFYRIIEVDVNGKVSYSVVVKN